MGASHGTSMTGGWLILPLPLGRTEGHPRMSSGPSSQTSGVTAIPCLLLDRGKVLRATERGPVPAIDARGRAIELFDVIDGLSAQHRTLYLVDLAAIEGHDPQLDYIQEISRDVALWVDAGVRTAEQAIDVIVAGAQKATLSAARLWGPQELRRAWELSTNLIFELEIWDGQMTPVDPGWATDDPIALARAARSLGPTDLVLSFRGADPDWTLASSLSQAGPTWVSASLAPSDAPRIAACGAAGMIYPLGDELLRWAAEPNGPLPDDTGRPDAR